MSWFKRWFSGNNSALNKRYGSQISSPLVTIVDDVISANVDSAMQISAVWRAIEIISKMIGTLPIMVYKSQNGKRFVDRESSLWSLLHETPNGSMTPADFFSALIVNLLLRGNAYAAIERNARGEAIRLDVLPSDQVEFKKLKDGTETYNFYLGENIIIYDAQNVLHFKEMGSGVIGLSRLDYMRSTLGESVNAQKAANRLFANGGKPTGVLMIDRVLTVEQRKQIQAAFVDMVIGNDQRLFVLEADMKYQQTMMTPEDIQLLTTRQFTVQEIGRWFGVPSILLNQTEGTTTLGSSSADIIETFYKLTIRPLVVSLEQSIRKRVMTPEQRRTHSIEFNMDGLLRSSLKDRMEIYAKAKQNGIYNANEVRQLENMEPYTGGEVFTVQSNLIPVDLLGKNIQGGSNGTQNTIAQ